MHIVLNLNVGGLEKVVYDLVRFADRDEHSVSVLCLDEIGALGPAFEETGLSVESLGIHRQGIVRGVLRLAKRLRELRPQIVHTHNAPAHLVGAPAAWLSGVPVVVNSRHGLHRMAGWKAGVANQLATRLTHRMVAVSGAVAALSRSVDHVPEHKLAVIRNGVDLDRYRRRVPVVPGAGRKAIHAARLAYPTKDQRTLLRAVRLVVNELPDFTLDIVGDGPDRNVLESLCDELNLRANVSFLGFRHDLHELLPAAGMFLLSSTTEGLPMTILEAMAAGLPLVSTDVGGISEVVSQGQTGWLVPPQSPEAMAEAILKLARDPARAVEMGRAGRARVEQEFDVRAVAARYEEIYSALFNGKRR